MIKIRWQRWGWLLVLLVFAGCGERETAVVPTPTFTPQPIFPTPTPLASTTPQPTATVNPATPTPTATPLTTAAENQAALSDLYSPLPHERFGMGGYTGDVPLAEAAGLKVPLYYSWDMELNTPANSIFWQTVRTRPDGLRYDGGQPMAWEEIEAIALARPGMVWLVGNEPDVIWQDNMTPEQYAEMFFEFQRFIKEIDPTAKLAMGGISQVTPLRLQYLDRVLAHYESLAGEAMPVDVWTIHTYILREEKGSWGVDIPPGFEETEGLLYEIEDHGNIELFKQQIVTFRAWMATNGYQERPLAITEFGILMPFDYGFPPERVIQFMQEAVDYMETAENETGLAADNGRLVQYWFWFALNVEEHNFPTGNLYNHETDSLTEIGEAYAALINARLPAE